MSLSLDGALSQSEQERLDAYLAEHPEAGRELSDLHVMKKLLGAKGKVAANPYFWTRVSDRMKQREEEAANLLPFPRKYLPLVSAAGVLAFIMLGITVFIRRDSILQYLSDQSEAVQQAYESSVLKGSVMPLFADLGNDDVLQFALFGTLLLDKESETALRVDEGSTDGYRIEVGLTSDRRIPKVTVRDLIDEVRPSVTQVHQIDSVLREAGKRIELAGFYAENNALAIDPEITRLNRIVLSNIAAILVPVQRERFDRFLEDRNAQYAIAASQAHISHPPAIPLPRQPAEGQQRDFIVITPDSFVVTALGLNVDSIVRGPWSVGVRHRVPDMQVRLEHLVRAQSERRARFPDGVHPRPRVQVIGDEDAFKIEFDSRMVGHEPESMRVVVKPRGPRNQFFRFEFRTESREGRGSVGGDVMIEMHSQMDSMMRQFQAEQEAHFRNAQRLDSLLRGGVERRSRPQREIRVDSLE